MNDIPPNDPYNPQAPQGYVPPEGDAGEALDSGRPSLGAGPGKIIVFGIIMFAVIGLLLSSLFSDGKPAKPQVDILAGDKEGDADKVARAGSEALTGAPSVPLPPPPTSKLPPPPLPDLFNGGANGGNGTGDNSGNNSGLLTPPPPGSLTNTSSDIPPPPAAPPVPDLKTLDKGPDDDEKTKARIHSNMLLIDGGKSAAPDGTATAADQSLNASDPNRAFSANVLAGTGAQKATATRLSNLNQTIAQGKIVNAVLETAINTDLPGTLRAIVSRDIYAEAGRNVLIPKGSRLIGTYNTGVAHGQNRVMIVWTRLIRPDGIDIAIGSSAVDGLGHAGIGGFVDNKYMEIFSTAMLTTVLSIGAAKVSDMIVPSDGTTTTNTDGSSTTTNSAAAVAAASSVQDLSSVGKGVLGNLIDVRPTITIDQGTRVNVFVNKDLIFPNLSEDAPFVR